MRILSNKEISRLFKLIMTLMSVMTIVSQIIIWFKYREISIAIIGLCILTLCGILAAVYQYFRLQDENLEDAVTRINAFLSGDDSSRIDCDEEGELNRLFSSINNLSAVLNSKANKENSEKIFLRNTISDISHQLKTPLAALNIYNGILEEAQDIEQVQEFVSLSEKELDRIETLVQNLLKITRLDAGSMTMNKSMENIAELIKDIQLHFAYRATSEGKELNIIGSDNTLFYCDGDWMTEAIENLVKNALDHTQEGNKVTIEWKQFNSLLQIIVRDNGSGIHPEDIHHIFKRFYRSRFTSDKQGLGLGLPLAKAIVEEHGGTIEVDSELGVGTTFTINFLIPTKL